MKLTYQATILDNGLRVLTCAVPHTFSVGVGFYLGVGSRYEDEAAAGAAHFVEHMLFKGTERRPSAEAISTLLEGHGGMFNAATGQESTVLWAKMPRAHLALTLDVLADMLRHSLLDRTEVEKERRVILEEIHASRDVPEELVSLLAQDITWPGHPLGRDVAGTPESVDGLSRDALWAFLTQFYAPQNTVLSVAGDVQHEDVVALAAQALVDWRPTVAASYLAAPSSNGRTPRVGLISRRIEQSHFVLQIPGLGRHHPDRYGLALTNVILGESMSSRLFLEVRERLGLAYAIDSYVNFLSDTGVVGIYGAVAARQLPAALSAVLDQLRRLREEPPDAETLRIAKEYTKGRLILGLEDTMAVAGWFGRQTVLGGKVLAVEEVVQRIEAITAEGVQRVASDLLHTSGASLAVVGPHRQSVTQRLHDLLARP